MRIRSWQIGIWEHCDGAAGHRELAAYDAASNTYVALVRLDALGVATVLAAAFAIGVCLGWAFA